MAFLPPIGISDFHRIRRERLTYVDKTSFVQRLLAIPSVAFLVPRPRRFGKTLNLNTARCFKAESERAENFGPLFEGLSVWDDPAARIHFQRYPVVFLSFKDLKFATWPECLAAIELMMAEACARPGSCSAPERLTSRIWPLSERARRARASGANPEPALPPAGRPPRRAGGAAHRRVRYAHPRRLRERLL
jgi:hypothetical protein